MERQERDFSGFLGKTRTREGVPFPMLRNWSPTWMVSVGFATKNFWRHWTPKSLFPTSTHTSLPPLKAQKGRKTPLLWISCWAARAISSSCSLCTTIPLGLIVPTDRLFLSKVRSRCIEAMLCFKLLSAMSIIFWMSSSFHCS